MDISAFFISDSQPSELVKPGVGTFDDPADSAHSAAMFRAAAGDVRDDAALAKGFAMRVEVIAAVGMQLCGFATWGAGLGGPSFAYSRRVGSR